ncbi:sulfatase-like hydrolase/transferase [Halioglobus sp. Uisw_031]|uniref:sulfatase-like hydrolase/transferase n=1 Tax=Halioglobus sp. Uisw_031 TaxID=3230977 RepID=UPI0039E89194
MISSASHGDKSINALHILTLWSFAVAQPLYDLLAQYPTFFIAHDAGVREILGFTLLCSIVLPTILALLIVCVGFLNQVIYRGLHYFLILILIILIILPALKEVPQLSGTTLITVALFLGSFGMFGYARSQTLREISTICSIAIFIFPSLFLFYSPISSLIYPRTEAIHQDITIEDPISIVMVVFDEFSGTHLLDENENIDAVRYPNFSALAEDSHWFPNATMVADATHKSVPSILTGTYYRDDEGRGKIPALVDYPLNMFTLYDRAYTLNVREPITKLLPKQIRSNKTGWFQKNVSIIRDASIVYSHIVSPDYLAKNLPDVTQNWRDFLADKPSTEKVDVKTFLKEAGKAREKDKKMGFRINPFTEFLASIHHTEKPSLNFIHLVFPHTPYEYLPSGQRYHRIDLTKLKNGAWDTDGRHAKIGFQRHLLQLGYTDTLIGDLVEKLRIEGLYDKSLIIITADHGVSFRPGHPHRSVDEHTMGGMMPVPLFIKLPHQKKGVINKRRVSTIDILPTIAEVTGITLPWQIDGYSVFDSDAPERSKVLVNNNWSQKKNLSFEYSDLESSKVQSLQRMLSWFGSGASRVNGLWEIGPKRKLIGQRVGQTLSPQPFPFHVKLDQEVFFQAVDNEADSYPAFLSGKIIASDHAAISDGVAVAVNQQIEATAEVSDSGDFATMLPKSALKGGKNSIEVFLLSIEESGDIQLLQSNQKKNVYRLDGEQLFNVTSEESVLIQPQLISGHMTGFQINERNETASAEGWAVDVTREKLVDEVIIFLDEKSVYAGKPTIDRADSGKGKHNNRLSQSSFSITLPQEMLDDVKAVRVFATLNGVASELTYGE